MQFSTLVPTRRGMLVGAMATAIPAWAQDNKAMRMSTSYIAYVGCRTTRERNARGDGIVVYRVSGRTWSEIQLVGGLLNPSYLAFDRHKKFLYAVHGDSSEISAFQIADDGTLTFLNRVSCRGKNPVHLTIDPSNQFVIVANHLTVDGYVSNIVVLPRRADGGLDEVSDLVPLAGAIGPNRNDQPFAKPHQVAYDTHGRYIIVPDKGCDLVRSFSLSAEGKLKPASVMPAIARPGAGPRHIAFHPNGALAYVVNELDSTITSYHYDSNSGGLTPFQRISATSDDFTGYSTGSEIALLASGKVAYVSNRGSDTVGAFSVGKDGFLTPLGWASSGGKTPRFFALAPDEQTLYAANEDGDSITALPIAKNGSVSLQGVAVHTGSPTCIIFSA